MNRRDHWYLHLPVFHRAVGIVFINLCLLSLVMAGFYSFFATPGGLEIRMPRLLSTAAEEPRSTVDITAENVLYFDGRVVTLNDLKKLLAKQINAHRLIFIRADRRASLGRVADVWDLCRGLNSGRVYIIAAQER